MTIAIISMIRDAWGGSEELWAVMAEKAIENNHKVIHLSYKFTPLHPKMQVLIAKGLITYSRPSFKPSSNTPFLQLAEKAIFFVKKRMNNSFTKVFNHNPDIVLYNGTCYSIAEEHILLKHLNKAKCRFFILGHFNNETGLGLTPGLIQTISQAYHTSEKVFFIAQRSIQNAKRHLAANIPNALVVRNPVNIDSIEIIPYPSSEKSQFAMVGNLRIVHKGQDIALEVLSSNKWKQRNWHLNIYGSGEDEAHLKRLVDFFRLNDNVTFHGRVNNIREVWKTNHVLLMPSHMEGMPLAVVEAMICGRPVVVTDVGGNTEWIEEAQQGFIAEAPTVHSFGNAMERLWDEKNNWESIGKSAHEKAMKLYDPEPGKTLLNLITA